MANSGEANRDGSTSVENIPVDADFSAAEPGDAPAGDRRAVLVAGSGRSGTSTLAVTLQLLGLHVPQPEVAADHTNPKGFGESQWVVDFHRRLLDRARVAPSDARPQAWFDTGQVALNEQVRERASAWLSRQCTDQTPAVVLKDPRLAWFLGLWRSAALRSGVTASCAVMLRPPAEVVLSKQTAYGAARLTPTTRAAGWVNLMLHTERATRGMPRAFIGYPDLVRDWTVPVHSLGERFGLRAVTDAAARDIRLVHEFIDADLHRVRGTVDDLELPTALRSVVLDTWDQLSKLTDLDQDTVETRAGLDELRLSYLQLYGDAEAIAQSTLLADRRKRAARAAQPQAGKPQAAQPQTAQTHEVLSREVGVPDQAGHTPTPIEAASDRSLLKRLRATR